MSDIGSQEMGFIPSFEVSNSSKPVFNRKSGQRAVSVREVFDTRSERYFNARGVAKVLGGAAVVAGAATIGVGLMDNGNQDVHAQSASVGMVDTASASPNQAKVEAGAHPQKYQQGNVTVEIVPYENKNNINNINIVDKVMETVPINLKEEAKVSIPLIAKAFADEKIDSKKVLAYGFATSEYESNFDVSKVEIDGEEQAKKLNYEGGLFYGRGLIQLTHERNYAQISKYLSDKYPQFKGLDLVNDPKKALDPNISPYILAAFFKLNGIVDLVENGDMKGAREKVVGKIEDDDTYNNQILKYINNRTDSYLQFLQKN